MRKKYVTPSVEKIEVEIERGFAGSPMHVDPTSISPFQEGDVVTGNAVKDQTPWGDVDW